MLYKIDRGDIRESNDNIDSTPAFVSLTSRELKYIFLVYDFESPLRQLSLKDRQEQSAENAGYKRENAKRLDANARKLIGGKIKKVQDAIPVFKGQLHDLDREALEVFDTNLKHYMAQMKLKPESKEDWDINIKVTDKYEKLLISRKRIIENLNLRADYVEEEESVEEGELSTLDKVNEKIING